MAGAEELFGVKTVQSDYLDSGSFLRILQRLSLSHLHLACWPFTKSGIARYGSIGPETLADVLNSGPARHPGARDRVGPRLFIASEIQHSCVRPVCMEGAGRGENGVSDAILLDSRGLV